MAWQLFPFFLLFHKFEHLKNIHPSFPLFLENSNFKMIQDQPAELRVAGIMFSTVLIFSLGFFSFEPKSPNKTEIKTVEKIISGRALASGKGNQY